MTPRLWLPLIAIFLLLVAGCGSKVKRADLVFINGAEPETLDPPIITGQPEERLVETLFEGLTRFDRAGHPEPGVAASWDISPDKRTYTFHLRPDARWSDGTPVTARDFMESWKRTLTPQTGAAYAYQLFYLKNGHAYADGRLKDFSQVGVHALDEHTLQVELENPTPFFLDLCATPPLFPVPMWAVQKYGDDWVKPGRMVSNGAYELEDWRINDRILLRKNPFYWDRAHVSLDTVKILPIADANVAYNFYASGEADLTLDKGLAPPALLDDLKKRPDFHAEPFLGTYFLRFNCISGPFKDERVRRAFSLAVDKARIVGKITRAGERPASSLVPPGIRGYASPDGLPYNPAEARRLLAEAGYPGGKGFPLVRYLYAKSALYEPIAVELQSMWRDTLGVTVSLTRQEWKVYLASMTSLDYEISGASWVGDYPDPNTFLDMFTTGNGNNRTGWGDPSYDALIAAAAREADPVRRFAILAQAEQFLIAKESIVCPLYFYVCIQLYDPKKLGGLEPNIVDEHPIRLIERK